MPAATLYVVGQAKGWGQVPYALASAGEIEAPNGLIVGELDSYDRAFWCREQEARSPETSISVGKSSCRRPLSTVSYGPGWKRCTFLSCRWTASTPNFLNSVSKRKPPNTSRASWDSYPESLAPRPAPLGGRCLGARLRGPRRLLELARLNRPRSWSALTFRRRRSRSKRHHL